MRARGPAREDRSRGSPLQAGGSRDYAENALPDAGRLRPACKVSSGCEIAVHARHPIHADCGRPALARRHADRRQRRARALGRLPARRLGSAGHRHAQVDRHHGARARAPALALACRASAATAACGLRPLGEGRRARRSRRALRADAAAAVLRLAARLRLEGRGDVSDDALRPRTLATHRPHRAHRSGDQGITAHALRQRPHRIRLRALRGFWRCTSAARSSINGSTASPNCKGCRSKAR